MTSNVTKAEFGSALSILNENLIRSKISDVFRGGTRIRFLDRSSKTV